MAKTIIRRTAEQIVAEYEQKIAAVKARAAAKQAKASPEGAAFLVAARALQKAQGAAQAAHDEPMDRAIEAALAALAAHVVEAGLRMPSLVPPSPPPVVAGGRPARVARPSPLV
jgi:hypothetical protein